MFYVFSFSNNKFNPNGPLKKKKKLKRRSPNGLLQAMWLPNDTVLVTTMTQE